MTDRTKLYAVADSFDLPIKETPKCLTFANRRYFFNAAGEIDKIIDLELKKRFRAEEKK